MDSERNSRLIDFWIDSEEKKKEPKPTPVFNLVWDSFFGWIWYVCMFLVFMGVYPYAQAQNIEMPDSWTAPSRIVFYNDCCCDSNTVLLNQIYQNQLFNDVQNRPSTIKEIHETHFSSSSSLSDILGK